MERASEPVQHDRKSPPPATRPAERTGSEAVDAIVRAYTLLENQATVLRGQFGRQDSAPSSRSQGPRLQMAFPPLGTAAAAPRAAEEDQGSDTQTLVRQARLILSAMAAADVAAQKGKPAYERRRGGTRRQFEVPARLRLWADGEAGEPWFLYTRDAEPRGLGFITPDRLPLGYGGTLALTGPDGRSMKVDVTLVRCAAASGGWYHGGLTFVRPQHVFAELLDLNG